MAEQHKQEIKKEGTKEIEKKKEEKKEKIEEKEKKEEKKPEKEREKEKKVREEELIRILGTDIPINMKLLAGLTKIKGVSWSFSNAVCKVLNLDENKKVSELSEIEIEKITRFIKHPMLPSWLLNRRRDMETGSDIHLVTTELDLRHDFDIRAMKKMKSYKGIRHLLGQPVRGQRTRAHFRKGRAIGVQRIKVSAASAAKKEK